jgi:hypothetical protein
MSLPSKAMNGTVHCLAFGAVVDTFLNRKAYFVSHKNVPQNVPQILRLNKTTSVETELLVFAKMPENRNI